MRSATYRQLLNNSEDAGRFSFSISLRRLFSLSSRSPRASPETSQSRSGMRRPARVARNHAPGRRPAKPPFRHYERNARMRQCETEGTAHVQRPKVSPRRDRSPQTAAVERREASVPAGTQGARDSAFTRVFVALCACGRTSFARRRVPLHPSACRRSAPSLCVVRETAKLGGAFASRER